MAADATPLSYQWRFNEVDLPGKTTTSLVLTNLQLTNVGGYAVVVSNVAGSVTRQVAHLEVDPTFTKITSGKIVNDGGVSFACAWGDYDDDGFIDLFVTNWGLNYIATAALPASLLVRRSVLSIDCAEEPPVLGTGLRSRMAYGNSQSAVS